MKKKAEENSYKQCGREIKTSTSNRSICAGMILEQTPSYKKKGIGFWSIFFTLICCLLLTISFVVFVLLLFIYALNENIVLPAIGFISSDWLALFFDSWHSFVFGGSLVLIPILLIVLINTNRARIIYLAIGCASIVAAMLSIVMVVFRVYILKWISGEWQDILVNTTNAFKDFGSVCAIILIMIGITCLSIYSGIVLVKGGKDEKDT